MKLMLFMITLAVLLHSTHAAAECSRRPQFTSNEATNCCKVPDPKWKEFPQVCNKYMSALNKPISPCSYECILNTTNSMKDGKFNATILRPLISKLYDDKVFLEVYNAGFEKCSFIVTEKTVQLRPHRMPSGRSSSKKLIDRKSCSPFAMKYIMCAHTYVFVNCPASAWTASTICEDVKRYAKNCHNSYGYRGSSNESRFRSVS